MKNLKKRPEYSDKKFEVVGEIQVNSVYDNSESSIPLGEETLVRVEGSRDRKNLIDLLPPSLKWSRVKITVEEHPAPVKCAFWSCLSMIEGDGIEVPQDRWQLVGQVTGVSAAPLGKVCSERCRKMLADNIEFILDMQKKYGTQ